jgi:hypothetical protein
MRWFSFNAENQRFRATGETITFDVSISITGLAPDLRHTHADRM